MNRELSDAGLCRIIDLLTTVPHLAAGGVGDTCSPCSIAAINLAVTGQLTDRTPSFMSRPVARWVRGVQDTSPAAMRDSAAWRMLLPSAANTGRKLERHDRRIIFEFAWRSYNALQATANRSGFGSPWADAAAIQGSGTSLLEAAEAARDVGHLVAGQAAKAVWAALTFDSCEQAGAASGLVFSTLIAPDSDCDPAAMLGEMLSTRALLPA